MKVFLAGATGVIGRPLVKLLREAGHAVTGTTRSPGKAAAIEALGASAMVVDAFDAAALTQAVAAARPEVVIHQLTDLPDTMDPARRAAVLEANARLRIEGTRNLMAAAQASGARRVVALENAVTQTPGIDGVVLRYGRLYGPGTWFAERSGPGPLSTDAAAHAALLAVTRGAPGIYNIAEDDGALSIEKARRELGFDPGFRMP